MWMLGSIMCIAGHFVFVELGLTIPRWPYGGGGGKISAMRSGDGLNYVREILSILVPANKILVQLHAQETVVFCDMYVWDHLHVVRECCSELCGIRR